MIAAGPPNFIAFAARRTREAADARLRPLVTVDDQSARLPVHPVGNAWSRRLFGGDAYLFDPPSDRPAISLVFVESRDRNTRAEDPSTLGGGPTDRHLIYEGLSRVATDGVLAGAATAVGPEVFFSVWHPELVALRRELGLPRHPAQIVVSADGHLDLDGTLLFNVPDVPVFVLAGATCRDRCRTALAARPWLTVVPIDPDLREAVTCLRRDDGLRRISVVGGRTTATSLVDAGLVQDIWLTTTSRPGGMPDTPWYAGQRPPQLDRVILAREHGAEGIEFAQFEVRS